MMHDKARHRLGVRILSVTDPAVRDQLLDQYNDYDLCATEWDADQWGFNPERWMSKERAAIAARGGTDWPRE